MPMFAFWCLYYLPTLVSVSNLPPTVIFISIPFVLLLTIDTIFNSLLSHLQLPIGFFHPSCSAREEEMTPRH